jgi:hypothetical protein
VRIFLLQVNASALDFLVTAISRWRLKKRIEKLESTISEVNKSTLLGISKKKKKSLPSWVKQARAHQMILPTKTGAELELLATTRFLVGRCCVIVSWQSSARHHMVMLVHVTL